VILVIAASVASYLGVRAMRVPFHSSPYGFILTDPDSNLRWRLVTRAVRGETPPPRPESSEADEAGAPLGWVDADNAPFGRPNEWTSPMTYLGIAAVWTTGAIANYTQQASLEITPLWLGPAIGLISAGVLLVMGWRLAGAAVGLAWLVAWPALPDVLMTTEAGNVDHHGFHGLLMILIYGGLLVARRKWRPLSGTLIGIACAMGLWSGATEFLPLLLPVVILAAVDVVKPSAEDPDAVRLFWRRWWVAGSGASILAMLLQFGPKGLFHTQLEYLSLWHVAAWAVAGGALWIMERAKRRAVVIPLVVLGALGLLALIAGALKGFDFGRLHIVQDEQAQRIFNLAKELQPIGGMKDSVRLAWRKTGLLLLGLLIAVRMFGRLDRGERFLLLSTLLVGEMALWQGRWSAFFAPLLVMTAGLVLGKAIQKRRWLVPVLIAVATIGPWTQQAAFYRQGKHVQWDPLMGPPEWTRVLAADIVAHQMPQIAQVRRPIIVAPIQLSTFLSGTDGTLRVIGSPYWSNIEAGGVADLFKLYCTTDDEEFRELMIRRQVSFILDLGPKRLADQVRLGCVVLYGWAPDDPRIEQRIPQTAMWRYIQGGAYTPAVSELVARIRPMWRVLYVPLTIEFSVPEVAPPAPPTEDGP